MRSATTVHGKPQAGSEYHPDHKTGYATLKVIDGDWDLIDLNSAQGVNPLYKDILRKLMTIEDDSPSEQSGRRTAAFEFWLKQHILDDVERAEALRDISGAYLTKFIPEPIERPGLPTDHRPDRILRPRAPVPVPVQVQPPPRGREPALALAPELSFTLDDISKSFGERPDHWEGWLPSSCCVGLAAKEGCGKTILTFEIIRRIYHGEPWPDGALATFPKESRVLIVASDHHFWQIAQLAESYKIPGRAILFSQRDPEDITDGTNLDDPEVREYIEHQIIRDQPALVWVDTLGASTALNMSMQHDCAAYFTPMKRIAVRTNTTILFNTHLASGGEAIGKRLYAHCRSVWHMTEPDPERDPDRRKLWVKKTTGPKPDPLGMTITPAGCTFDDRPPFDPDPKETEQIKTRQPRSFSREFLLELVRVAQRVEWNDAVKSWKASGKPESTLRFARDGLVRDGVLRSEPGPGRSLFLSFP